MLKGMVIVLVNPIKPKDYLALLAQGAIVIVG